MKKSFQIWQEVRIPANSEKVLSEQLLENFSKCTGAFIVPISSNTNLSQVSLFLKIAQQEILPKGTSAMLLAFNGNVELKNVVYDFKADNIPARSSEMDLTFTNKGTTEVVLDFYLVLEN